MEATSIDWWDAALRLLAAAGLGGVIGLEREADGQAAGFRTHLLLALGAALFGLVSVGAFEDFTARRGETNVNIDVTRIASYVAAGVGFIGGGAILKHAGVIKGITTAASLWTVAAIGLAAGLGFWSGAVTAAVIAVVALALLRPISALAARLEYRRSSGMLILLTPHADLGDVVSTIRRIGGDVRSLQVGEGESGGGSLEVQVVFWTRDERRTSELIAALGRRDDVVSVRRSGPVSV